MAYVPQHNYRIKDGLETGDPDKVIYGSDLQDDFEAIARDLSTLDTDNVADQADLDKEIQDRKDADSALQAQINAIDTGGGNGDNNGGGGSSDWADIENKPTEFPPSAHTHEIAEVNGLQDALDNAGGVTYTLPVVLRSGDAQLPLTVDGKKLAVMTRGGELELPLAA
jgi:hypothetical protein